MAAACLLVLVVLAGGAAQAATVRLCNGTKDAVEFALNYRETAGLSRTQGWWHAAPGQCSEPVSRGTSGIYFLHVKKVRGGSLTLNVAPRFITACAALSNFTDRPHEHRGEGKLNCTAHGMASMKFMRFEMSRSDLDDVLTLEPNGHVGVRNGPQASAPGAAPQTDACKRFSNLC